MAAKHYRELIVWQKAMDLVEAVYRTTVDFPREEMFGLTAQVRRGVVSIPSNIAEGQGRESVRDFLHFLSIARGSLQEVETQLLIAVRLAYLDSGVCDVVLSLASEVGRLINGLYKSLSP